jgi:hypothetical protein
LTYPASSSDYAGHLRLLASAGVVWQRDGLNPQSLFVSNTHTDASNYERGGMWWDADALKIGTQDAGTGVARVVHVQNLPTSNPGPGILWNDNGSPAIGT